MITYHFYKCSCNYGPYSWKRNNFIQSDYTDMIYSSFTYKLKLAAQYAE